MGKGMLIFGRGGLREYNKPRNNAFYVKFPGGFIGVYSSTDGPVLFVNDGQYFFTDPTWSVSAQRRADVKEVSLIGSQGILIFEYSFVALESLGVWSKVQFDATSG